MCFAKKYFLEYLNAFGVNQGGTNLEIRAKESLI